MRAVSTVLDVSLFLLLVSAAVATLAVPAADPPSATADRTAETLAATTTNVTYPVPAASSPDDRTVTATGTDAALLGRGAVANLTLAGESVAPGSAPFRRAVRNRTEAALAWSPGRTAVVALWEPYPGAPLRGRLTAGADVPPGVEVSTATATVPASIPSVGHAATEGAEDGYRGVADPIAAAVVETTVAADGVGGTGPGAVAIRDGRLRAYTDALGIRTVGLETGGGRAATAENVERRLAEHLAADMRDRFDSPGAAADAVRTGTVRVVVREWSP